MNFPIRHREQEVFNHANESGDRPDPTESDLDIRYYIALAKLGVGDLQDANRDIVTYKNMERVWVNTHSGNDNVLCNDTVVPTVINMGAGDDEIVIGTVRRRLYFNVR